MNVEHVALHAAEVLIDAPALVELGIEPVVHVGRVEYDDYEVARPGGADAEVDGVVEVLAGEFLGLVQDPDLHVVDGLEAGDLVLAGLHKAAEEDLPAGDVVDDVGALDLEVAPASEDVDFLGELGDDGDLGGYHRVAGEEYVVAVGVGGAADAGGDCVGLARATAALDDDDAHALEAEPLDGLAVVVQEREKRLVFVAEDVLGPRHHFSPSGPSAGVSRPLNTMMGFSVSAAPTVTRCSSSPTSS